MIGCISPDTSEILEVTVTNIFEIKNPYEGFLWKKLLEILLDAGVSLHRLIFLDAAGLVAISEVSLLALSLF